LRAGEVGVEQQRVGAELDPGQDRLEQPAVVAAEDAEALLGLESLVPQGIRERVGPAR
jgi:hypothetical protein